MILLTLQILVSLYLLFLVLGTASQCKIKLNIHNVSFGILMGVLLITSMVYCYKNFPNYVYIGMGIGIISEILNFFKIRNAPEIGVLQKWATFLVCVFFWPQALMFVFYIYKNYQYIDANSQS